MPPQELLLWVFCLVDDSLAALKLPKLRSRGSAPTLTDAEIITIELVGEFWGLDADKAIYRHFRAYHAAEFPNLARVCRTTFVRQAANLWAVKQALHRHLADQLTAGHDVWLSDRFPLPVCQFARATFCVRFAGEADYGYDHCIKLTFYGFRVHLRTDRAGVIQDFEIAPARASDRAVLLELAGPAGTIGIGDRGYYSPDERGRAGRPRGAVPDPVHAQEQGTGPGACGPAERGPVSPGDGQRSVGGSVPREADVGAGSVAPDPPGDPQGAQSHGDGLDRAVPRA